MRLILLLALLVMTSCAPLQDTKGKEIHVDITYRITIEGNGDILFSPESDLGTLSGAMQQDSASDLNMEGSLQIPVGGDLGPATEVVKELVQ